MPATNAATAALLLDDSVLPKAANVNIATVGPLEGIVLVGTRMDGAEVCISRACLEHLFPKLPAPPEQCERQVRLYDSSASPGPLPDERVSLLASSDGEAFYIVADTTGLVLDWIGYRHGLANQPQSGAKLTLPGRVFADHWCAARGYGYNREALPLECEKTELEGMPALRFSIPVNNDKKKRREEQRHRLLVASFCIAVAIGVGSLGTLAIESVRVVHILG
jgi:hypothetical protein